MLGKFLVAILLPLAIGAGTYYYLLVSRNERTSPGLHATSSFDTGSPLATKTFKDDDIGVVFNYPATIRARSLAITEGYRGSTPIGRRIVWGDSGSLHVITRGELLAVEVPHCEGPCITNGLDVAEWDSYYELFSGADSEATPCRMADWVAGCRKERIGEKEYLVIYTSLGRNTENAKHYIFFAQGKLYLFSSGFADPGDKPLSPDMIDTLERIDPKGQAMRIITESFEIL